ncbi:hypothetical protein BDBG_08563 [Blastomyces gilchristii SLH14081]|uniref:FAD linked oxidase N-terminal domain-containing protein n=1 Tax=Blastomyces gilchristii (strain SLH14081) TaxID=559298 RepID=A0A179UZR9_BLAGS|nr:uncharacterized protein BDBG_08563 [Blastomyces gilchristii SLH14081]OAT13340.1 hypothetical protein BDBG_08563 [Blastomyces gilchristii SLH14081]
MADSTTPISTRPKSEVVVPQPSQPPSEVISRWSDHNVELPAMVIVPNSEEDIFDAIKLAKERKLTLIPADGGHGSFVPITSNTLYLDMRKFNSVVVDTSTGTLISQNEEKLDVSSSSEGEGKALFNALCGAGHGLGVITSVTMKIFPLKSLNLTNDCIWTRRAVFPSTAIAAAAEAFAQFSDPPPPLAISMVFFRTPPNAPVPDSHTIMLSASYYGPAHEGELAVALLFEPELVSKANKVETLFVPMATVNNGLDFMDVHGGYKGISSCYVSFVNMESIKESFESWARLSGRFSTNKAVGLGRSEEGQFKFLGIRGRSIFANTIRWAQSWETNKSLDQFCDEFMEIARRNDAGPPRTLANNQYSGIDLEELYPSGRVAELKRVKSIWDAERMLNLEIDVITFRSFRHTFANLKNTDGLFHAIITLVFIFPDANDVVWGIEEHMLLCKGEEPMVLKKSLSDGCSMLAVACSSVHWTSRAAFVISLVAVLLSVFYSCLLQCRLSSLYKTEDVKDWLSEPSGASERGRVDAAINNLEFIPRDEEQTATTTGEDIQETLRQKRKNWLLNSVIEIVGYYLNSACTIQAPALLLNYSVGAFLTGFGIYLGCVAMANFDPAAGEDLSYKVLIVYCCSRSSGIIILYCAEGARTIPSPPLAATFKNGYYGREHSARKDASFMPKLDLELFFRGQRQRSRGSSVRSDVHNNSRKCPLQRETRRHQN